MIYIYFGQDQTFVCILVHFEEREIWKDEKQKQEQNMEAIITADTLQI